MMAILKQVAFGAAGAALLVFLGVVAPGPKAPEFLQPK